MVRKFQERRKRTNAKKMIVRDRSFSGCYRSGKFKVISAITCIESIGKTKMQLPSFVSTFIVCLVKKKEKKEKEVDE